MDIRMNANARPARQTPRALARLGPCLYLLCLALLLAAPGARASEGTMLIVRFLDVPASVEVGLRQGMEEAKARDPAIGAFTERALADYDFDEAARRLALLLDKRLDADDLRAFKLFIESPTGVKIGRIFRVHKSAAGLREAFNALPRQDFVAADRFFSTPSARKALDAINSQEFKDWGRQYGEELVCNYVEKNLPEALERARRAGKCLGK